VDGEIAFGSYSLRQCRSQAMIKRAWGHSLCSFGGVAFRCSEPCHSCCQQCKCCMLHANMSRHNCLNVHTVTHRCAGTCHNAVVQGHARSHLFAEGAALELIQHQWLDRTLEVCHLWMQPHINAWAAAATAGSVWVSPATIAWLSHCILLDLNKCGTAATVRPAELCLHMQSCQLGYFTCYRICFR
jgi:hypothetical protein